MDSGKSLHPNQFLNRRKQDNECQFLLTRSELSHAQCRYVAIFRSIISAFKPEGDTQQGGVKAGTMLRTEIKERDHILN